MEDWQCCLCLDLCYKPTVNGCGHVFCYREALVLCCLSPSDHL